MNNKVIASCGICNTASLNLFELNDDYVVAGINNLKARTYKIYSTNKGLYFNFGGSRWYLHEFMRV